jgi:hypothetical protein
MGMNTHPLDKLVKFHSRTPRQQKILQAAFFMVFCGLSSVLLFAILVIHGSTK